MTVAPSDGSTRVVRSIGTSPGAGRAGVPSLAGGPLSGAHLAGCYPLPSTDRIAARARHAPAVEPSNQWRPPAHHGQALPRPHVPTGTAPTLAATGPSADDPSGGG